LPGGHGNRTVRVAQQFRKIRAYVEDIGDEVPVPNPHLTLLDSYGKPFLNTPESHFSRFAVANILADSQAKLGLPGGIPYQTEGDPHPERWAIPVEVAFFHTKARHSATDQISVTLQQVPQVIGVGKGFQVTTRKVLPVVA